MAIPRSSDAGSRWRIDRFEIVGVADRRFTGVEPGRPTDMWLPYAMYNPRAFGTFGFNWFRVLGRMNENVRLEQAQSVLQAAFTGFRRDRSQGFGPNRSPESVARFVNTPLYLRVGGERSVAIAAPVRAIAVDPGVDCVAGPAHRRLERRESVSGADRRARARDGAPPVDRRRPGPTDPASPDRERARGRRSVRARPALCRRRRASGRRHARVGRRPACSSIFVWTGGWPPFAGALTLLTTALFGLAPALRASGVAPIGALKAGGGRAARAGAMRPFVAVQVAFGLVVLFVGSLLVLSFARLSSVNPGFATSDVLLLSLEAVQRVEPQQQRAALFQVLDRLAQCSRRAGGRSAESTVLGRAWTHNIPVPGTPTRHDRGDDGAGDARDSSRR